MRISNLFRAATTIILATVSALFLLAGSASAASRGGHCDSGEFCYFFNSDQTGSASDLAPSIGDYGTTRPSCYDFKGAGNGTGVCVKNNAASVWNRTDKTVRVYFNSNYVGAYQDFTAGAKGNLNVTLKNNNASHQVIGTAAPSDRVSRAIAAARAEIKNHPLYAWGGGHGQTPGATRGHCDDVNGYDTNGVCVADDRIGFDCSGLMRWAFYQATATDWGSKSTAELSATRPAMFGSTITSLASLRPGDLVLTDTDRNGSVNHTGVVSAVTGSTVTIIEAPNTSTPLREHALDASTFKKAYRLR